MTTEPIRRSRAGTDGAGTGPVRGPADCGSAGVDLSDLEFWARPLEEREAAFAVLRQERRAPFFAENEDFGTGPGRGYYALTRHADVLEASRRPEVFSSASGIRIGDKPEEFFEVFDSMIEMDDPRHARLRRIVSRAFTPKMIQKFADDVERTAGQVVDAVIDRGSCDFVTEIAAPLPLKIICDLMGIDGKDQGFVFERTNVILGAEDPEYVAEAGASGEAMLLAANELAGLVQDLARSRAAHPTDDLTSALVNANVDGEKLTRQELASFFVLLVLAGNETTRNAISHGLARRQGTASTSPGPQPACRVRRRRPAFLPRCPPGPPRDHRDVRRTAAPGARYPRLRRTVPAAFQLPQRHQAPAVRVHTRRSSGLTAGTGPWQKRSALRRCRIRG
jgi:hypothetical protein